MRVATFNILHGRSMNDGTVDVDRFRAAIRSLDADVLGLQEVDRDQPRSLFADLTAVAAQEMGAVAYRFVAAVAGTPGASWVPATGGESPGTAAYGVALLSRYPVSSWQVFRLPRLPLRFPLYIPGAGKLMVVREEPRAVVVARVQTPLGEMSIANTHLSFVPGWNRVHLRRLRRDLAGLPAPRMLLGDLNARPPAVSLTGMRSLAALPTFPQHAPARQIDHILTDDPNLVATACDTPQLPVSDHRALVVDLARRDDS